MFFFNYVINIFFISQVFDEEEGINLSSQKILEISVDSKAPGLFAQNLAVAILGPAKLREMSVTGRLWTRSKDKIARPGSPQIVMRFIYGLFLYSNLAKFLSVRCLPNKHHPEL